MNRILLILAAAFALTNGKPSRGVTIDFESLASGTLVSNQYLSDGLLVRFETPGGQVRVVGEPGVHDIGGSGTHVLDAGNTSEPLRFSFVDPEHPEKYLAVEQFSLRLGNGGLSDSGFPIFLGSRRPGLGVETGIIVDAGTPGETYTSPKGRWTQFSIGSHLSPGTVDRQVIDDLTYTQLPEPGTATMAIALIGCIGAWGFLRRR